MPASAHWFNSWHLEGLGDEMKQVVPNITRLDVLANGGIMVQYEDDDFDSEVHYGQLYSIECNCDETFTMTLGSRPKVRSIFKRSSSIIKRFNTMTKQFSLTVV